MDTKEDKSFLNSKIKAKALRVYGDLFVDAVMTRTDAVTTTSITE